VFLGGVATQKHTNLHLIPQSRTDVKQKIYPLRNKEKGAAFLITAPDSS
jgi:hypothetical protein